MVLPVYFDPRIMPRPAAFLPIMATTVESMKLYSYALLFLVGFGIKFLGTAPFWLIGLSTIVAFPLWSILDMALGSSHNLWPLEWMFYGFDSMFGVIGAALA